MAASCCQCLDKLTNANDKSLAAARRLSSGWLVAWAAACLIGGRLRRRTVPTQLASLLRGGPDGGPGVMINVAANNGDGAISAIISMISALTAVPQ